MQYYDLVRLVGRRLILNLDGRPGGFTGTLRKGMRKTFVLDYDDGRGKVNFVASEVTSCTEAPKPLSATERALAEVRRMQSDLSLLEELITLEEHVKDTTGLTPVSVKLAAPVSVRIADVELSMPQKVVAKAIAADLAARYRAVVNRFSESGRYDVLEERAKELDKLAG